MLEQVPCDGRFLYYKGNLLPDRRKFVKSFDFEPAGYWQA